jgi:hypothetical protein
MDAAIEALTWWEAFLIGFIVTWVVMGIFSK